MCWQRAKVGLRTVNIVNIGKSGLGIREWGLGSGVTNDFDFCEERKKDGLEHVTNGGVRIAQRLELRVGE